MSKPDPKSKAIRGFGAMGDSFTNRYNGRDGNPHDLNWVEQLVLLRTLPFGRAGDPYAFLVVPGGGNTNVVDAASRQAPALAALVEAGHVNIASLEIGSHDFGPIAPDPMLKSINPSTRSTYDDIYHGRLAGGALEAYADVVLGYLIAAADRVAATGAKVIVSNIPDFGASPFIRVGTPGSPPYPDAAKRGLVTEAVVAANQKLKAMTKARGMPLLDLKGLIDLALSKDPVVVGGVELNLGPPPYPADTLYFWMDYQHPGTIVSGLFANMCILATNKVLGTSLEPLADEEILRIAGLAPSGRTSASKRTFFNVKRFVHC